MEKEKKHELPDYYGAMIMLKGFAQQLEKDLEKPEIQIMRGSYELVIEKLQKAADDMQAELYKGFTGSIVGLAEKIKGDDNEN